MKPGSVIVDMGASELGGNCELSRSGVVVTTENGVKVVGYTDLPARMPSQPSQLFGQNIVNLLKLATPGRDGVLVLDMSDEVLRGMCVALDGEATWPPPPVSVSAAPLAPAPKPEPESAPAAASDGRVNAVKTAIARHWWKVLLSMLVVTLVTCAPVEMACHFVVFMLSCAVGFFVITNVTHSLHTPLMPETNAISGIVVGALLQLVGKIPGRPIAFPHRNAANAAMVLICVACIVWLVNTQGVEAGIAPLGVLTGVSLVLGAHLVLAIGGGDMPVVVSMLN